jgi:hypothetical protein
VSAILPHLPIITCFFRRHFIHHQLDSSNTDIMPVIKTDAPVLGWPKGSNQSGQNYTGKYLTSNNILNVTVNRTINL